MLKRCVSWCALFVLMTGSAWAHQAVSDEFRSVRRLTALVLKDADPLTREAVMSDVERAGGHVVHVLPTGLLLAELPNTKKAGFQSAGVDRVETDLIDLEALPRSQQSRAHVWNLLLDPPPAEQSTYQHFDGPCGEEPPPTPKSAPPEATSEYMIGTIVVSLLHPYCENSPDCTATPFSDQELNVILARTIEGMDWWAAHEPDAQLTFLYEPVKSIAVTREPDVDCPLSPATCGQDDHAFRTETLAALGYPGIDPFAQERAYIDDLRHGLQPATQQGWDADWGFIAYIPRSVASHRSFAKIGGPYEMVWDGINAETFAHETGHVFRARDEYHTNWPWGGCQSGLNYCRDSYLGRVVTGSGNHDFVDEYSIMGGGMAGLSNYGRAAIGWRDSDANHAGWSTAYELHSGTPYADIVAEDFDGNSTVDLASITATAPSDVTVWLNEGAGAFVREAEFRLPSQATSLAWDWGVRSLIISEVGGPIRRWKREDDGSWNEIEAWRIETFARTVTWLDINYDGRNDLVVLLDGGGIEAYSPDLDAGRWVQLDAPSTPATCDAIDLGDFNEDALPDLVAACTTGLYLWHSDSQGNWTLKHHLLGDFWLRDVWASDLNGDHSFDVAASLIEGGVRMYVGDGSGQLVTFPHPQTARGKQIWLADFDHNLTLDLAIGTWNPPGVQVWLNVDEAGQWNLGSGSEENARVGQIAAADFDRDGFMDIARTSAHERRVWIRFNSGEMGDHLLDPIDTYPGISSLQQVSCQGSTISFEGVARDVPLSTSFGTDITINEVTEVEYRVSGGSWQPAQAVDGAFDQESEEFEFAFSGSMMGSVEVRARNSVGNTTPIPTSEWYFCWPW